MCEGIYPLRQGICWVSATGDVLSNHGAISVREDVVQTPECVIGWVVVAAPIFPAFNDSFVISEYLEMNAGASIMQNVADEKFEADTQPSQCLSHLFSSLGGGPMQTSGPG